MQFHEFFYHPPKYSFLPFSVFLVLAIFLFAIVQIVFVGVYPYKKIAWLHGR